MVLNSANYLYVGQKDVAVCHIGFTLSQYKWQTVFTSQILIINGYL